MNEVIEIPVRIEHKIDPWTGKDRTVITGIGQDSFLHAGIRGKHGTVGIATVTIHSRKERR